MTTSLSAPLHGMDADAPYRAVHVTVTPALTGRNRLTCAFRPLLALPHLLLVGGPAAMAVSFIWRSNGRPDADWSAGTGVLGAVASVAAMIAWFAIVFVGVMPKGLWNLAALYLRWRVRVSAYVAMLRDEYPPFGDDAYPAQLQLEEPTTPRNRVTVAFRLLLAIPHLLVLWLLGIAWFFATLAAWVMILVDGEFPPTLYRFSVAALQWCTRVEAYVLLLNDEYPPFSLDMSTGSLDA